MYPHKEELVLIIEKYLAIYHGNNPKGSEKCIELEKLALTFVSDIQSGKDIDSQLAIYFINEVEEWKAMGIQKRIKGRGVNSQSLAKKAIINSIKSSSPKDQIEAFHPLTGFGSSINKDYKARPAKVASAAVRFLFPEKWGVVDWRSATIAKCLLETNDISEAKILASKQDKSMWEKSYVFMDSTWAVALNKQYSKIGEIWGIKNNSIVDQFLFGISLELWPLPKRKTC